MHAYLHRHGHRVFPQRHSADIGTLICISADMGTEFSHKGTAHTNPLAGLHPSDVQPTKVVEPPPEFYALYGASSNGGCSSNGVSAKGAMGPKLCVSNALFFSTQGAQSLASKLASGDYDG
eukprot:1160293-Pelagomonas_calceolata.AAC.2